MDETTLELDKGKMIQADTIAPADVEKVTRPELEYVMTTSAKDRAARLTDDPGLRAKIATALVDTEAAILWECGPRIGQLENILEELLTQRDGHYSLQETWERARHLLQQSGDRTDASPDSTSA